MLSIKSKYPISATTLLFTPSLNSLPNDSTAVSAIVNNYGSTERYMYYEVQLNVSISTGTLSPFGCVLVRLLRPVRTFSTPSGGIFSYDDANENAELIKVYQINAPSFTPYVFTTDLTRIGTSMEYFKIAVTNKTGATFDALGNSCIVYGKKYQI